MLLRSLARGEQQSVSCTLTRSAPSLRVRPTPRCLGRRIVFEERLDAVGLGARQVRTR